jgi:hypothetical protein
MDKNWNIGIMEFWNIGFKTEKKFLPNIPSFQLSSIPTFHHSNSFKRRGKDGEENFDC